MIMNKIRITHWQTDCLHHPLSEKFISGRDKPHWSKKRFSSDWYGEGRRFACQSGGGVVLQTPLICDQLNVA
jgi:hypothetical protein